jgi:hypothetical protein
MKQGDLVYFSAKSLAYDFEKVREQYGILLEYINIPGKGNKTYPGWKTLWGETVMTVYEEDISLVAMDQS